MHNGGQQIFRRLWDFVLFCTFSSIKDAYALVKLVNISQEWPESLCNGQKSAQRHGYEHEFLINLPWIWLALYRLSQKPLNNLAEGLQAWININSRIAIRWISALIHEGHEEHEGCNHEDREGVRGQDSGTRGQFWISSPNQQSWPPDSWPLNPYHWPLNPDPSFLLFVTNY